MSLLIYAIANIPVNWWTNVHFSRTKTIAQKAHFFKKKNMNTLITIQKKILFQSAFENGHEKKVEKNVVFNQNSEFV